MTKARIYIQSKSTLPYSKQSFDFTPIFNKFPDIVNRKVKARVISFGFVKPVVCVDDVPPICLHSSLLQNYASYCFGLSADGSAQTNKTNEIIATIYPSHYKGTNQSKTHQILSYYESTDPDWFDINRITNIVHFEVKLFPNVDIANDYFEGNPQWMALIEFEINN